ncbi:MAG: glyoxalase/bleomycin resistance/extradiol dioxygenase family protein [Streptomycetaceae bacterium]|nr:glyoxalase/bleomycin resistance/extradiol dioxygenase family protein [Streptomycetaceae bacterium]
MDALYPRLLVRDFAACFAFYAAVLPPLAGAKLIKGTAEGPYANWDVDDQAVSVLFDRGAMAEVVGTGALPADPIPAQDQAMLVLRVADVDTAAALCVQHGAALVVPPTDRPDWGLNLRAAHLRDPEGRLIELQSY